MCIADPGRVASIDDGIAVVELPGRVPFPALVLVPGVAAGDWVTVLAGTIVERLDPADAAEIGERLRAAERGEAPAPPRARPPHGGRSAAAPHRAAARRAAR